MELLCFAFQHYLQFIEEVRLRRRVYDWLRVRVEQRLMSSSSDDAVPPDCITSEKLAYLKNHWSCTCDRMRLWLRKLDNSLPGVLGQIGDWLCRAEEQLRAMPSDEYDSLDSAVEGIQQQLVDISVKLTACFIAVCLLYNLFACDGFIWFIIISGFTCLRMLLLNSNMAR